MTVAQLAERLHLECLALPAPDREIDGAYAGDLLSWVMGRAGTDCLWATIMNNMNVLAVATLADVSVTVICEGCEVSDDLRNAAMEKGVNLVRTELPIYELCVAVSEVLR
ncbi:MAG: hypothetical protein J6D16_04615 [Clostridia bacterium]|nr:hypothetical protein [Clostridia bacterium]